MSNKEREIKTKKNVSFCTTPDRAQSKDPISYALLKLRKQNEQLASNTKVPIRWLVSGEDLTRQKRLNASSHSKRQLLVPTDQELAEYIIRRFGMLDYEEGENKAVKNTRKIVQIDIQDNETDTPGDTTDDGVGELECPTERSSCQRTNAVKRELRQPDVIAKKTSKSVKSPTKASQAGIKSPTAKGREFKCSGCKNSYKDEISLKKHMVHVHRFSVTSGKIKIVLKK